MSEKRGTSASELLGKRVLIGITRVDHNDNLIAHEQFHGIVAAIDDSIHVRLSTGDDYALPPHPAAFFPAKPGEYRLRSTNEVVVDPDFTSTWTVKSPPPAAQDNRDA